MFCMEGRKFDPLSFLHGFSKVRKFLTRTPALPKKHRDDVACGAHLPWRAVPGSVTRKVRMNARFFFSRKFAPFALFALRLHRKIVTRFSLYNLHPRSRIQSHWLYQKPHG